MTVAFHVRYWTEWGQNLVVVGSHPKLGEWDVRKGAWMHCQVRDAASGSAPPPARARSTRQQPPNLPPHGTPLSPPGRVPARR